MFKLIAMALLALTPHTAEYAPIFACEVSQIGLSQAVSNALGNGTNSDGWIEGSLFSDLHFDRNTSEAIVNAIHSELFASVTEHVYTDCE